VISAVALVAGIPLGVYLVQVLGSANAFLEFVKRSSLPVEINNQVLLFGGAAPSLSALLANEVRRFDAPPSGVRFADRVYHDPDGRIRGLIEAMEQEFGAKEPGYIEMIRCHLIEILVRATRSAAETGSEIRLHPAAAAMTGVANAVTGNGTPAVLKEDHPVRELPKFEHALDPKTPPPDESDIYSKPVEQKTKTEEFRL